MMLGECTALEEARESAREAIRRTFSVKGETAHQKKKDPLLKRKEL